MSQTTINNGDTGLVARGAINDNFTELYGELDYSADINTFLGAADNAAARTALGAGTSSFSGAFNDLTGVPNLALIAPVQANDFTAAHGGDYIVDHNGLTNIQVPATPAQGDYFRVTSTRDAVNIVNGITPVGAGVYNVPLSIIVTYTNGSWSVANGAITPVPDTGWTAAASTGDKTDSVENYSGAGIDGTMAAALELVSSGLGTALQQDEARIKELIHFCQALQTALVAKLLPNA